ncbi:MAG: PASTA domain-containing protein, partial [Acidimicrobiales bacterium]|nr:PASTA domain-containing protein [Acidimicrobiales bacterium]
AGSTLSEALAEVFDLDFRYVETMEADPEVEEGLVLRTEPPAGELLRGGETLTIVLSSGVAQAIVPSVEGLLADSARQQLVSAKFEVQIEFESTDDPTLVNKVLAQSPPANQEIEEGGVVRIVVGQEPPPEETTTTTTTTTTSTTTTTTAAP